MLVAATFRTALPIMAEYRVIEYRSGAELRKAAAIWDDLWQRSDVTIPTARAILIADWIEQFAPHSDFHAITVQLDGQMLAAIPICGGRIRRVLSVARLPENAWSWAGELLLDPQCEYEQVLDLLVDAIVRLPWPLLWCDGVPLESTRWQQLLAAFERDRCSIAHEVRFRVGTVDMTQPWEQYRSTWSGNFRGQMRKMSKRAEELGGVEVLQYHPLAGEQLNSLLQKGFEIGDRSWKGVQSTSVLKSPALRRFIWQQAAAMAQLGHLELTFLGHGNVNIAFEYGWRSKGVYYSPKVGYDQAFAYLSPGQLLRLKMAEQFFADGDRRTWDFLGPLTDATERWSTGSYSIDRLIVGTRGFAGRMLIGAFEKCWPTVRKLRNSWQSRDGIKQEFLRNGAKTPR